jgi:hypothetical protein
LVVDLRKKSRSPFGLVPLTLKFVPSTVPPDDRWKGLCSSIECESSEKVRDRSE